MTELEIIVLRGHKFVTSQVVTEREITIGSGEHNTVKIAHASVAPAHAVVHFTGRSCLVEDLDSATGIVLGNERVSSHMMKSDEEIGIGEFTLRFVIHREASEHTPLPAASPLQAKKTPAPERTEIMNIASLRAALGDTASAPKEETSKQEPPRAEVSSQPRIAPVKAVAAPAKFDEAQTVIAKAQLRAEAKVTAPLESKPAPSASVAKVEAKALPLIAPDERRRVEPTVVVAERPTKEIPMVVRAASPPALEEEDEDEDINFVPAFSLVSRLTDRQRSDNNGPAVAEAILFEDEVISGVHYLDSGAKLRVGGGGHLLVAHSADGQITVASRQPIRAHVFKDGRPQQANLGRKGKNHLLLLPRGSAANLELNPSERLHLQFRAPIGKVVAKSAKRQLGKREAAIVIGSILIHLIAFAVIAITSARRQAEEDTAGRFAQIETKDLELEPPKPVPPPPPPPKQEKAPPEPLPKPVPAPKAPPVAHKQPTKVAPPTHTVQAAPPAAAPAAPKPSAAASNLLSALGGSLSGGAPTSAAAAATTNLDAVQAPRSGGFKVAGMIGKMPGDGLRLAAAGGAVGRIDTKSATELTKGGKLGKVEGNAPSGNVRGVVTAPPARSVEVQGSLDRGEIQKVVNAHVHEIQACYERQLVHDPNLSGKVVAEWAIALTGSVGTVKIKNSTVRATEVSTCIQAAIKRWTFPKPKGGQVTVTYPFVFSTVGM